MAPELNERDVVELSVLALTIYDAMLEGNTKPTVADRLHAMRAAVRAVLEEQRKGNP